MRYYLLNKPAGVVSACRDDRSPTVLDCLPPEVREGLFPVGRLDKYTEGAILLTDDGKLCRALLRPEAHVEKEYLFWGLGTLTEEGCAAIRAGMQLKGWSSPSAPARIVPGARSTVAQLPVPVMPRRRPLEGMTPEAPVQCGVLWLTEGKRHQVKRLLEAVGCPVLYLKRTAFGPLRLEDSLAPGEFRPLTGAETGALRACAEPSQFPMERSTHP